MLITSLLMLFVFFMGGEAVHGQATPQTLSVCALIGNLEGYSGKRVAVRGKLIFSDEVFAVTEENCETRYEAGGRRWPNAINLVRSFPGSNLERIDPRSMEFLSSTTRLLRELYGPRELENFQVVATFVGVLRARDSEEWARLGPTGFGHLGALPAELSYMAVEDIVITGLRAPPPPPTTP